MNTPLILTVFDPLTGKHEAIEVPEEWRRPLLHDFSGQLIKIDLAVPIETEDESSAGQKCSPQPAWKANTF